MTLERSVLLLALTLAGLYVLPRLLPRKPRLRRGLQVLCIMAAMLDAAYILLTLLFVWAAGQKLLRVENDHETQNTSAAPCRPSAGGRHPLYRLRRCCPGQQCAGGCQYGFLCGGGQCHGRLRLSQ